MKIAVFDVCGTLYKSNTTFDFLDYYFEGNRSFSFFRFLSNSLLGKLINYPFIKFANYDLVRALAIGFLKGEEEKVVAKSAKYFVLENLEAKINNNVIELYQKYRKQGYKMMLISGSLECIVSQVAKRFEADDYFASKLLADNEVLQGRFAEDNLLHKKKLLLQNYPSIDSLIVVTDNLTDLDLVHFSNQAYVFCNKEKHKQFWLKQNIPHLEIRK